MIAPVVHNHTKSAEYPFWFRQAISDWNPYPKVNGRLSVQAVDHLLS